MHIVSSPAREDEVMELSRGVCSCLINVMIDQGCRDRTGVSIVEVLYKMAGMYRNLNDKIPVMIKTGAGDEEE